MAHHDGAIDIHEEVVLPEAEVQEGEYDQAKAELESYLNKSDSQVINGIFLCTQHCAGQLWRKSCKNLTKILANSYENLTNTLANSYENLMKILANSYENLVKILEKLLKFHENLVKILRKSCPILAKILSKSWKNY